MTQTALKFDVQVREDGRLELQGPFRAGEHVTVFVIAEDENAFGDLLAAAETSLGFWDNPIDDENWNDA